MMLPIIHATFESECSGQTNLGLDIQSGMSFVTDRQGVQRYGY